MIFTFPITQSNVIKDLALSLLNQKRDQKLAYFGEIHPGIIKKLDFKEPNIYGLEIFLGNLPEPNKRLDRQKKVFKRLTFKNLRETLLL